MPIASPSLSITVQDNVNPVETTNLASGAYSNDSTPTVVVNLTNSGAHAGQWINLFSGTTFLGAVKLSATDISNGTVSITPSSPLADGAYSLDVTLSNNPKSNSGNDDHNHSHQYSPVLTSNLVVDNVDTKIPVISGITVAGDNVVSKSEDKHGFTVTGKVTGNYDALVNQTVTIVISGSHGALPPLTGTIVSDGHGHLSFQVNVPADEPLPKGDYTVKVTVVDAAGNSGVSTKGFDSTACFIAGTMIMGPDGELPIEALRIGDLLMTTEGEAKPIRWIGRNTVSLVFADPLRTLPIRIKAGALDDNTPSRDLLVSPDHALLVDGVLVQAGALVNGTSIVRETNVPDSFVYYHVELHDHALILAENAPAETFIDNIDRMSFDNWVEHEALYGDAPALVEMTYPRAKAHRQVPTAIRRKLALRAQALAAANAAHAAA